MKHILVKMAFQPRPVTVEIPEDSTIKVTTDNEQIRLIEIEHEKGLIATFSFVEYWTLNCERVHFGSRIINWFKRNKERG